MSERTAEEATVVCPAGCTGEDHSMAPGCVFYGDLEIPEGADDWIDEG